MNFDLGWFLVIQAGICLFCFSDFGFDDLVALGYWFEVFELREAEFLVFCVKLGFCLVGN